MIDKFQRIARTIHFMKLPAIAIGLISLLFIISFVFIAQSDAGNRWLMPGFIMLLWAISTYTFIVNFQLIPAKADKSMRFFSRLKRNIHRALYWLVALIFLGVTVGAVFITYRMTYVWIKDYAG